jgi:hypothetical protein
MVTFGGTFSRFAFRYLSFGISFLRDSARHLSPILLTLKALIGIKPFGFSGFSLLGHLKLYPQFPTNEVVPKANIGGRFLRHFPILYIGFLAITNQPRRGIILISQKIRRILFYCGKKTRKLHHPLP